MWYLNPKIYQNGSSVFWFSGLVQGLEFRVQILEPKRPQSRTQKSGLQFLLFLLLLLFGIQLLLLIVPRHQLVRSIILQLQYSYVMVIQYFFVPVPCLGMTCTMPYVLQGQLVHFYLYHYHGLHKNTRRASSVVVNKIKIYYSGNPKHAPWVFAVRPFVHGVSYYSSTVRGSRQPHNIEGHNHNKNLCYYY